MAFRGLIRLLREWFAFYGVYAWLTLLLALLSPLADMYLIFLGGWLIDGLISTLETGDASRAWRLLLLMMLVWFFTRILLILQEWLVQAEYVRRDMLYVQLYDGRLARFPPRVFEDPESARRIKMAEDFLYRFLMLPRSVISFFSALILLVGTMIILTSYAPIISIFFGIIILGEVLITLLHGSRIYHIWDAHGTDRIAVKAYSLPIRAASLDERVEFTVHGYARRFYERLMSVFDAFTRRILRVEEKRIILLMGWSMLRVILQGGVFAYTILLILARRMSVGFFYMIVQFFLQVQQRVETLIDEVNFLILQWPFLREYEAFARLPTERLDEGEHLPRGPLEVRFEHVWFRYPGKKRWVLRDVNLTIRPGERIALVGENGAGKTTLIKLLLGIYTPQKGRILVNGIPLDRIRKEEYYVRLGVLSQHAVRFHTPLREAFLFSRQDGFDAARAERALRDVGLARWFARLKHGFDTWLFREMPDGEELSGGEWQRLNAARMLYRQPELLILDEPTSNIDALGEKRLYELLFREAGEYGLTLVLITHRLASIVRADRIIVLHEGRIVCEGRHDELMQSCRVYHDLYEEQYEGAGEEQEGRKKKKGKVKRG